MNIGLFYGSSTCYTEMAAEKIRDIIGPELVTLHNLHYFLNLMRRIRASIENGTFEELRKEFQ